MEDIDIMIACIPVLALTIFFMILITMRIHATSRPVSYNQWIDPDAIGIDGLR
jgi:phosphatidylglycerophosphatase A